MEKVIKIHIGYDPDTGEQLFEEVTRIVCNGYSKDIDPNHIRVHEDPNKPKARSKKDSSQQTEMQLDDPRVPKRRRGK